MICKDSQPLSVVEHEGFQELMQTLAPHYKKPSRKYFTNFLQQKHEVIQRILKNKVVSVEHVSLATDIWTDSQMRCFLGITINFLEGV